MIDLEAAVVGWGKTNQMKDFCLFTSPAGQSFVSWISDSYTAALTSADYDVQFTRYHDWPPGGAFGNESNTISSPKTSLD